MNGVNPMNKDDLKKLYSVIEMCDGINDITVDEVMKFFAHSSKAHQMVCKDIIQSIDKLLASYNHLVSIYYIFDMELKNK